MRLYETVFREAQQGHWTKDRGTAAVMYAYRAPFLGNGRQRASSSSPKRERKGPVKINYFFNGLKPGISCQRCTGIRGNRGRIAVRSTLVRTPVSKDVMCFVVVALSISFSRWFFIDFFCGSFVSM